MNSCNNTLKLKVYNLKKLLAEPKPSQVVDAGDVTSCVLEVSAQRESYSLIGGGGGGWGGGRRGH